MPGPGLGRSADFAGGLLDGLVDVLRAHAEFLGDVLFGLQPGLAASPRLRVGPAVQASIPSWDPIDGLAAATAARTLS
jgi:hypothetical protein